MSSPGERFDTSLDVMDPEEVRVPAEARDFEGFRAWALSDGFPERGRIDFLDGETDVDARGPEPRFSVSALAVSALEISGYQGGSAPGHRRMAEDAEGWVRSPVLGLAVRLGRRPARHGTLLYRLEHRPPPG